MLHISLFGLRVGLVVILEAGTIQEAIHIIACFAQGHRGLVIEPLLDYKGHDKAVSTHVATAAGAGGHLFYSYHRDTALDGSFHRGLKDDMSRRGLKDDMRSTWAVSYHRHTAGGFKGFISSHI
jgi:hypothetical protein